MAFQSEKTLDDVKRMIRYYHEYPELNAVVSGAIGAADDLATVLQRLDARLADDPALTQARFVRAAFRFLSEDIAGALFDFEDMVRAPQADLRAAVWAEAYNLMGRCHLGKDEAQAVGLFERSIEFNPRFRNSLLEVAYLYDRLGRMSEARTAYARYLAFDSTHPTIVMNYAIALHQHGDHAGATALIGRYFAAGGDDPDVAIVSVNLAVHYRPTVETRELVRRSLRKTQANADLWYASFSILSALNDNMAAIESAARAAALNPGHRFQSYRCHTPLNA